MSDLRDKAKAVVELRNRWLNRERHFSSVSDAIDALESALADDGERVGLDYWLELFRESPTFVRGHKLRFDYNSHDECVVEMDGEKTAVKTRGDLRDLLRLLGHETKWKR